MRSFTLIITLLFLGSCNNNPVASFSDGRYSYSAFDSTGNRIITGWLRISFSDSVHVQGVWDLHKIGNPQNTGPQLGHGQLAGSLFEKDSIRIELNPQYRDNNLLLRGHFDENYITGEWTWITIRGYTSSGMFKAYR